VRDVITSRLVRADARNHPKQLSHGKSDWRAAAMGKRQRDLNDISRTRVSRERDAHKAGRRSAHCALEFREICEEPSFAACSLDHRRFGIALNDQICGPDADHDLAGRVIGTISDELNLLASERSIRGPSHQCNGTNPESPRFAEHPPNHLTCHVSGQRDRKCASAHHRTKSTTKRRFEGCLGRRHLESSSLETRRSVPFDRNDFTTSDGHGRSMKSHE
jgi:hypothetical protein